MKSQAIVAVIIFALLCMLLAFWIAWPYQVKSSFLAAIDRQSADDANSYCDVSTIVFRYDENAEKLVVSYRSRYSEWFSYPVSEGRVRGHLDSASRTMRDVIHGRIAGEKGGFWFGHIEIERGKVIFVSD